MGILACVHLAAIPPRFGAGPRTAIVAAGILWQGLAIGVLILMAIGLHTPRSYVMSSVLYLVSAIVASVVGAALYREHDKSFAA